jgi:hypothetical protein
MAAWKRRRAPCSAGSGSHVPGERRHQSCEILHCRKLWKPVHSRNRHPGQLSLWFAHRPHHDLSRILFPPTVTTERTHPWVYLCLPASKYLEYAKRVFDTPAEVAYSSPRFSVWRRNSIKRPLTRIPNEALVVRFQCSRLPPPSADISAVLAMNRTLYERARVNRVRSAPTCNKRGI